MNLSANISPAHSDQISTHFLDLDQNKNEHVYIYLFIYPQHLLRPWYGVAFHSCFMFPLVSPRLFSAWRD